jgi:diacylglycerol kinase family enzyme
VLTVILNPSSGVGRQDLANEVAGLFHAAGVEARIRQLASPAEIPTALQEALEEKAEVVVAGGGDGTINAVATGLVGGPTPLGVLPLGTLNHFAKDLHIPLDLPTAVQTIAARHVTRVDVGRLNDFVFLNNASLGVYPSIVTERERLRHEGYAKWIAFGLATLHVLRRGKEVSVRLEADGRQIVSRTPFLFIGNNEYLAEGIRLGARASLDGGRLFVYFAPPVRTRDLPKLFAQALLGRARQDRALASISAVELWVDTPSARQIRVACDGELLTLRTPLHCRVWPGALNVIVPAA